MENAEKEKEGVKGEGCDIVGIVILKSWEILLKSLEILTSSPLDKVTLADFGWGTPKKAWGPDMTQVRIGGHIDTDEEMDGSVEEEEDDEEDDEEEEDEEEEEEEEEEEDMLEDTEVCKPSNKPSNKV